MSAIYHSGSKRQPTEPIKTTSQNISANLSRQRETIKPLFKRALSPREAAAYCGISVQTLKEGRIYGNSEKRMDTPKYTKLGPRKVVYLIDDLDAWLETKRAATDGSAS